MPEPAMLESKCEPTRAALYRSGWAFALQALCLTAMLMINHTAIADEKLAQFRHEREQVLDTFRRTGQRDPHTLARLEVQLRALASQQTGEAALRTQVELATIIRFTDRYQEAATMYEEVAAEADRKGYRDIAFEAWIGSARAHIYGTRDHGAASRSFDKAVAAAGSNPTPKQLHDLSAYRAQLLDARGEFDAALAASLETAMLAEQPDDRFYAQLDRADILLEFAQSCDYRQLIDEKSTNDPRGDGWGGCRRAISTAESAFNTAQKMAQELGWTALAQMAGAAAQDDLEVRRFRIDENTKVDRLRAAEIFKPRQASKVLVNQSFYPPTSKDMAALGAMIDRALPSGRDSPRVMYLQGSASILKGDRAGGLQLLRQAANALAVERRGFFDPQRRGTVIEDRVEIMRDLALVLLANDDQAAAFDTFESFRSRGLNELAAALARPDLSQEDRQWLAELVDLDARESARQIKIRERVIAGGDQTLSAQERQELTEDRRTRTQLLSDTGRRDRFANVEFRQARLADLQRESSRSGTAIMLYWTTTTNLIVWVISPTGASEVRTVFLPETVLNERVEQLVTGSRVENGSDSSSEEDARQLYLYLLAPFEQWLKGSRLMIIPQGSLMDLPFEALMDNTGKRVIEKWTVSYAPSATMALQTLTSKHPQIGQSVRAIVDEKLNAITSEVTRISAIKPFHVDVVKTQKIDPSNLSNLSGGANVLHVLVHGQSAVYDPLLFSLQFPFAKTENVTAAQFLAVPLRSVQLAVFSSCDSGTWTPRISNELYGLPWALIAGGAENVVVSRWRVLGTSNADWIEWFYTSLGKGETPAAAAALASRKMIASGRKQPFYWAAMRVIGR
jgi:CHAT domain-containing protein